MLTRSPAAVLFDLDGTLLDTAPDFYRILNQMRAERQQPAASYARVRQQVSNGAAAMINSTFDITNDHPDAEPLRQQLLQRYQQAPAQDSMLFDGIEPLLEWLEQHQIPWGIVTNKPERFCRPILQKLQLEGRCKTMICPDHVEQRKPHPEGLLKACGELSQPAQDCLYVGDHRRDIEAGNNASMMTVAALYGYLSPQDHPQEWHADLLIESPRQLLKWLQDSLNNND